MSEYLSAAAERLGIPEPLVERSARARAQETGASVDEVLQAWAGGEAGPAPSAAPAAEPAPEPEAEAAPTEEPAEEAAPRPAAEPAQPAPSPAPAAPAAQPVAVAAQPQRPPILEGRHERPFAVLAGAVGLLLLTLLAGFAVPAVPTDEEPVYSSAIALGELARQGREIYLSEGCAACHTQTVRPIVADAGLGPVTLSDSNQVLGARRYGPDLAHIGSRVESDTELLSVLTGAGEHPSYSYLSQDDLRALVAYLLESR